MEFEWKQKKSDKRVFCCPDRALHQEARKKKNVSKRKRETEIEQHRRRNKRGKAAPVCKCVIKRRVGRVEIQGDIERETGTDKRERQREIEEHRRRIDD